MTPTPPVRKEAATVRRMFGAIAPRYDLLNHLLSGGLDVLWRRAAARALLADLGEPPGRGWRVLDLCAGTLDMACAVADRREFRGKAVAADFALPMLRRGRRKLGGRRARRVAPVCADGLGLPFPDAAFDAVTVAFGVRNLEDLAGGLAEVLRVLGPGGRLAVLEFSRPANAVFRGLYRIYNRSVLPAVGGAISGHPEAYRYLPDTVAAWPDAPALARRIREAGFADVRFRTLTGGIVALHEARRPTLH